MVNDGGDMEEKAIEIFWRKGKRKTQIAYMVSGGTWKYQPQQNCKGSSSGFNSQEQT